jgi:hypothetical protein
LIHESWPRNKFNYCLLGYDGILFQLTTKGKNMQGTIDKLKKIGFKKVPTEKGFVMYELTPSKLNSFDSNFKAQDPIKKKVKR